MIDADQAASGLFASLRQMLATGLNLAEVRLALLGSELEHEKLRLLDALLWAGLALLLLGLGALLLCVFIVLLFWDSYRLAALAVLALLLLGAGLALLQIARQRLRSPGGVFRASATELAGDQAALRGSDY